MEKKLTHLFNRY